MQTSSHRFNRAYQRGVLSIQGLLVVLLVVVLLFGTRKLRGLGNDLGAAIRSFKEGIHGKDDDNSPAALPSPTERPEEPQHNTKR